MESKFEAVTEIFKLDFVILFAEKAVLEPV
jgi:hypothetical protein